MNSTVSSNIVIRASPRNQTIENRVLRVLFIGEVNLKRRGLEGKGSMEDQKPGKKDLRKTSGYPAGTEDTEMALEG